ncbi:MAG: clostripain-related cysteine peptidase [Gammaproteobacteria bacterium]|nr:clostripain-related cysteine peptidase [Gammaproteobacteria bacterium]
MIRSIFLILVSVVSLSSCSFFSKNWTFIVYLDGDNDLAPYNLQDLEEMKTGIQVDNIRVLVQFDQPDGVTAKRYEITEKGMTELEDIGEVNMADEQTLTDFLVWAKGRLNKPDHTILILSDHGNGWDQTIGPSPAEKVGPRSLFNDWDNGVIKMAMHNHRVRTAIEASGININVLGLDASIMGTIEAIYEFSDLAEVVISSQEVGYQIGWDYTNVFARLSKDPKMSIDEFSSIVVDSYRRQFEEVLYPSGIETNDKLYTLAAHRSEGVKALATALGDFASSTKAALADTANNAELITALQTARENAQHIDFYNQPRVYVDIKDFFAKYDNTSNIPALLDQATIASYHGADRPDANGLSVVFFKLRSDGSNNTYDVNYKNWDADTATGNKGRFINEFEWDEMLYLYNSQSYPTLF